MNNTRRYRCAIYTRKSHEEGLDQEFNSLDAQREACEAYTHSQAGLGWELSTKTYDDGGISGGHLERNGLQRLLADIKAGMIDIVVVYKVDRLTRSITDFAKLVDVFDEHHVSFVSVTQAFNTTNSMGRLTLNVLLSFAQFEREVTAERIRDKIASSKQKGMWMGGRVPFGYRNQDKKLIVDEEKAKVVQLIFDLYREKKNVRIVKAELDGRDIRTRQKTSKKGETTGGNAFSTGNLYAILKNPIYAGKIKHKEKVYSGNHVAIIVPSVWDEVQLILAHQSSTRANKPNQQSPALLAGLLFDHLGKRLIPHHANKKGKKYHYYVTEEHGNDEEASASKPMQLRLPMQKIETILKEVLVSALSDEANLLSQHTKGFDAEAVQSLSISTQRLAKTLSAANHAKLKTLYASLIQKVIVGKEGISIFLNREAICEGLNPELHEQDVIKITKPICIKRRGQELRLVIGGQKHRQTNPDHALIKLIAKAHLLKLELETGKVGSIKDFATKHAIDHGDAKNLIPLGYLAPTIIEDILSGQQPPELTASRLKSASNLPILWNEQRRQLGFSG